MRSKNFWEHGRLQESFKSLNAIAQQVSPSIVLENFLIDILLDMYVKCGCLLDAHNVLAQMPDKDVISWTIIMAGHVQKGMGRNALLLYKEMLQCSLTPNGPTFGNRPLWPAIQEPMQVWCAGLVQSCFQNDDVFELND
ncbi:hypothetical protein GOP47_0019556 [Adiantum capillus-veneris]|uniref:Pentatricopeptide repeat-containing protein n=1 Tax=Adiantum capillus-veneris TaxID=13818 RepID=A0A9D4UD06_ADICA|nr:hypothetical protein GOP47_0019556 [Adiantum capillus-veneris]